MFQGRKSWNKIAWFTEFSPAFWIPLQSVLLSKWETTHVMLSCALIAYIFCGNFPYFWKSESMIHSEIFYKIMLIRIPGLKNDSCIFFSSLKFLYLDFLRGHGGTTTWTIFTCNLSSSCYRWDLIGRLSLETACSFKVLFPPPYLSNETGFF